MKALRIAVIYIAAIGILGALLAPWLYWGGAWLTEMGWLDRYPFHRYFNRALMIVGFVGVWPAVRALGIRHLTDVGLQRGVNGLATYVLGFLIGTGVFLVLSITATASGAQDWKLHLNSDAIFKILAACLTAGFVVGWLEEIFFRGVAYGGFRQTLSVWPALIATSVIYSIVHFLKPPAVPTDFIVKWYSGFELLMKCGQTGFSSPTFWPYFLTLIMAGMILGWTREMTGAVFWAAGLHGGSVFLLQLDYKLFEKGNAGSEMTFWFGGSQLASGWLSFIVLLAAFTVMAWLTLIRKKQTPQAAEKKI